MPNYYLLFSILENTNIYILYMPNNFMMVYIRKKKIKGKIYYYIVKGVYDVKGKLSQKVVRYLGNIENILKKFDFWDKHH